MLGVILIFSDDNRLSKMTSPNGDVLCRINASFPRNLSLLSS